MIFLARLRSFLDQWIISIQNYPISHLILIVITVAWIIFLDHTYLTALERASTHEGMIYEICFRVMIAGAFALPLTILKVRNRMIGLGGLLLGILFFIVLPSDLLYRGEYGHILWIIGSILVAWTVPSLSIAVSHYNNQDTTWSHFTHWRASLIQGVIGGAIVWGGISASIASIDFLFGVNIDWHIYQYIGIVSMVCVAGWIWLINLQQESEFSYPRWMRVFGQYIFLPLCVIYGLILMSYGIKIIATGQWPEGQLVYMVSGYVLFGLLTWFAVLPIESQNIWLSKAYRVLFGSFALTSGLMIGAIIMRIQQYGWTINRVLVIVLITWIVLGSIGSLIWSKRRWLVGLSTLTILTLLSSYIVPGIIKHHHLSQTKQLLTIASSTNTGDATQLYRSMDYLAVTYGTGWTKQIFTSEQIDQLSGASNWDFADQTMHMLGITGYDTNRYYDGETSNYWSFYSETIGTWNVAGYTTLTNFQSYREDKSNSYGFIQWNTGSNIIGFSGSNINIDLNTYITDFRSISKHPKNPNSPYFITGSNYQIIVTQISSNYNTGDLVDSIGGYLLVK